MSQSATNTTAPFEGIEAMSFSRFFSFIIWTVFWTVLVSSLFWTVVAAFHERDFSVVVEVWLIVAFIGLLIGVPVGIGTALIGFPIWKFVIRVTAALPGRAGLAIGAVSISGLAGLVLGLLTRFDLEMGFHPIADLLIFVATCGLAGTIVAWRVYAK